MTLITALRKTATELRADPSVLIAGTFATAANGQKLNPKHPAAACFCALGALYRNLPDDIAPRDADPVQLWSYLHPVLTPLVTDAIYLANDSSPNHLDFDKRVCRWRAGLAGVERLEELANELEANSTPAG